MPGETGRTKLSRSADQIPYFLFTKDMTAEKKFSGENMEGEARINHGVLASLDVVLRGGDGGEVKLSLRLAGYTAGQHGAP